MLQQTRISIIAATLFITGPLLAVPVTPYEAEFRRAAAAARIPVEILRAVCSVESSLNPYAFVPHDGATHSYGICQVQVHSATDMNIKINKAACARGADSCELWQVRTNLAVAARYLAHQYRRYYGSWTAAILSYNAGSVRYNNKGHYINQKYLDKVLARILYFSRREKEEAAKKGAEYGSKTIQ